MTRSSDARPALEGAAHALTSDSVLAREARVLTRYLLSRECPAALVQRYVDASRVRHREKMPDSDRAILRVALGNPMLLPLLDAAAAVAGRDTVLREKLLLMTAILETSPDFANEFLPPSTSRVRVMMTIAWSAAKSAAKMAIGLPLLAVVRRRQA